jgi:hypothetical protein
LVIGITLITIYAKEIGTALSQFVNWESSLTKLQKVFAQFNEEIKRNTEGLKSYFSYLDRLRETSRISIQIDNQNVPQIQKLRNELKGLSEDVAAFEGRGGRLTEAQNTFSTANTQLGKVEGIFRNRASQKAQEAFDLGFYDAIKEDLSKTDQAIVDQLREARAAAQAASDVLSDVAFDREKQVKEIELKVSEIEKEAASQRRIRILAAAQAEADIIRAKSEDILNAETSTEAERLKSIQRIKEANIAAAAAQRDNVLNDPETGEGDRAAAISQFETARTNAIITANRERLNIKYDYFRRLKEAEAQRSASEIAGSQRTLETISTQEEESLENRLAAAQKYFTEKKKMLDDNISRELELVGLNKQEINTFLATGQVEAKGKRRTLQELLAMRAEYENEVLQLSIDTNEKNTDIVRAELDKQTDLHEQFVKELEVIYGVASGDSFSIYAQETIQLNKELIKREISIGKYFKKRTEMERAFRQEQAELERRRLRSTLSLFGDAEGNVNATRIGLTQAQGRAAATAEGSEERAAANREVETARAAYKNALEYLQQKKQVQKQINDIDVDESSREADEALAKRQARIEGIFNTMQAAHQLLDSIAFRGFEIRAQQIEDEMSLLDRRTQKERESIEQGILNETEKQKKLGELRIKDEQAQEALEKKRRKLEYDRAKYQKISALFGIAVDTARAIVAAQTIPVVGQAMIPFIIATGALQAAAVMAQPLPKYAQGTKDHKGGYAVLGDGYRSELVEEPDGSLWVSEPRPGIYDVAEHAIVHPDAEKALSSMMVSAGENGDSALRYGGVEMIPGMQVLIQTTKAGFSQLNQSIKNQPQTIFKRDMNKDLLLRYGSDWYKYL